jgi:hypothetical protein
MNKTNLFCLPVNGVKGLSLILSEAPIIVVVATVSAIVSPCVVVGKVPVLFVVVSKFQSRFSVSRYQVSLSRSLEVSVLSEFCGVKVSGCTVKIQARSLVSSHFC